MNIEKTYLELVSFCPLPNPSSKRKKRERNLQCIKILEVL